MTHRNARYAVVKGDVLGGRYLVEKKLGSGTFGTVVEALDRDRRNVAVAVKVVRKQAAFLRQAKIEARLLKELRAKVRVVSQNIITYNPKTSFIV